MAFYEYVYRGYVFDTNGVVICSTAKNCCPSDVIYQITKDLPDQTSFPNNRDCIDEYWLCNAKTKQILVANTLPELLQQLKDEKQYLRIIKDTKTLHGDQWSRFRLGHDQE